MTRRGGQRPGLGGLWLLLVPAACCGGPPLIAGLAWAGALAWGGLGLALAIPLSGITLVMLRRRPCRAAAQREPFRPASTAGPGTACGRSGASPASPRSPALPDTKAAS
jgi:hypothetical protein